MRTIVVALPEGVAERVAEIARAEFRTPKAQVAVLLIEALSRRGAVPADRAALGQQDPEL